MLNDLAVKKSSRKFQKDEEQEEERVVELRNKEKNITANLRKRNSSIDNSAEDISSFYGKDFYLYDEPSQRIMFLFLNKTIQRCEFSYQMKTTKIQIKKTTRSFYLLASWMVIIKRVESFRRLSHYYPTLGELFAFQLAS